MVKATLMRATLHLVTASDYLRFQSTLQSVLTAAHQGILRRRPLDLELAELVELVRRQIRERPRTFAEITDILTAEYPGADPGAMRYGVRTHLPLVQVPVGRGWSYPGNPQFALAEAWLGQTLPTEPRPAELIRRYLAAFGPASVADLQAWSGLTGLKTVLEGLRSELVTFRDERRRELFDLPDQPLPPADTPAPPRLLPEFDNLLLGHQDRTRIIAQAHRPRVYLPGLRVAPTFLIDGFVAGTWSVERDKQAATLLLAPFEALDAADRSALLKEAERLVRFLEPDAATFAVRLVD